MLSVFLNVILPTFLVAAVGALAQRWRQVPTGALSQLYLYVFTPALVLNALLGIDASAGVFLRVIAAMLLATLLVGLLAALVSALMRHPRATQSAFLLVTVFPNVGNLALPVVLLAFGQSGLAVAAAIFAVYSAVSWTLGVFIASRSQLTLSQAFRQMFRIPIVYIVLLAAILLAAGWELPLTLARPIELLANGALPVMLLVLGFNLSSGVRTTETPSLVAAVVIRLIVAAPLAYLATLLLGLKGMSQQVTIVMAAMPTGVFTTIVSTEFQANPRFVTATVVTSTLASLGTLTIIIALAQRWLE